MTAAFFIDHISAAINSQWFLASSSRNHCSFNFCFFAFFPFWFNVRATKHFPPRLSWNIILSLKHLWNGKSSIVAIVKRYFFFVSVVTFQYFVFDREHFSCGPNNSKSRNIILIKEKCNLMCMIELCLSYHIRKSRKKNEKKLAVKDIFTSFYSFILWFCATLDIGAHRLGSHGPKGEVGSKDRQFQGLLYQWGL